MWAPSDMTDDKAAKVADMHKALGELLPDPSFRFNTEEEVRNMTDEQADLVVDYARRMLVSQLLMCEYHRHMGDDCGDYIEAATELWHVIWNEGWGNDWQGWRDALANVLLTTPMGGCDGEIRYDIFSEELADRISQEVH